MTKTERNKEAMEFVPTMKPIKRSKEDSPVKASSTPRRVTRDRAPGLPSYTNMTADSNMTYQDYAEMRERRQNI